MTSDGYSLAYGLIGKPFMSLSISVNISVSNTCLVLMSIGFPNELNTLPNISLDILILKEFSVNLIVEFSDDNPAVSSNTSIVMVLSSILITCPVRSLPSFEWILTISPYWTSCLLSKNTKGPIIFFIFR